MAYRQPDDVERNWGISASPGDVILLDETKLNCKACIQEDVAAIHRAIHKEKREKEKRFEHAQREIALVQHLYRPQQSTRVIVHNVNVVLRRQEEKDIVLASTSFPGKVIGLRTDIDEETESAIISVRVQLMRHPSIKFEYLKPCPRGAPFEGLESKAVQISVTDNHGKQKALTRMVVDVTDVSRESEQIVLGGRCKPDRCDDDCSRHTIAEPTVLAVLTQK
jgi:hypothetical protein